jgi:hypothetical protein
MTLQDWWAKSEDPMTRTKFTVGERDVALAAAKVAKKNLLAIISGWPELSEPQRELIGITVRRKPTPTPPPTVRPGVDITSSFGRTVGLHIHDSSSSSKSGKPPGVVQALIYTFVGATYPSDPSKWEFAGVATRQTHQVTFSDTVAAGSQVWVCCAWANRKGEAGPVSVPQTINLAGGMAQAA